MAWISNLREVLQVLRRFRERQTPPHPASPPSPPQKRGGEGARRRGGGEGWRSRGRALVRSRDAHQSSAFSPRAFRGEKVPKADEGCRAIRWHGFLTSAKCSSATSSRESNAPSSGFATFSPTEKRGGEGARRRG